MNRGAALLFGRSPKKSFVSRKVTDLPHIGRIATRDCSIPGRMMRPGPSVLHGAANHRLKSAWLVSRAFIDVNDEASQHQQCGQIMNHIIDCDYPALDCVIEPHQQTGDE